MAAKPVYVVCIFNVYADFPDAEFPGETLEEKADRRRCRHVIGYTAEAALAAVPHWCETCCDYNWTQPALLGEYPIKLLEDAREVVDSETLTCPHCGETF